MTIPTRSHHIRQSSTVSDLAERHDISESTVRREINNGRLEAIKIRRCARITDAAEQRWLDWLQKLSRANRKINFGNN